jgi:hypothetical protein
MECREKSAYSDISVADWTMVELTSTDPQTAPSATYELAHTALMMIGAGAFESP